MRFLQPPGWPEPRGYANGIEASGRLVFVGGQIGWDARGRVRAGPGSQVRQALANIVAVLAEADAGPEHVVRLTWYVVDREDYLAHQKEIGAAYRSVMGRHFPAMAVVQVVGAGRGARPWSRSRPPPSCPEQRPARTGARRRQRADTVGRVWVGSWSPCCSCSPPRCRRSLRRAMTRGPSPSIRDAARGAAGGLDRRPDRDESGERVDARVGPRRRRGVRRRGRRHGHDDRGGLRQRCRPLDRRGRSCRQRAADARRPRRQRAADGAAAARLARPRGRDDDRGRRRRVGPRRPRGDDRVRHPRRRRVRRDGGLRAR